MAESAAAACADEAPVAARKTKPSWGSVSIADRAINRDVERFGYSRTGMTTIEVDLSHLVMLWHLKEVDIEPVTADSCTNQGGPGCPRSP
jgi:hypothetical protein